MLLLGNLSIEEIEERVDVLFPDKLKEIMKVSQQEDVSIKIAPDKWHCFNIPFIMVCGSQETAMVIYDYLKPLHNKFKQQLQISIQK